MADTKLKITLESIDKTKKAFASTKKSLGDLGAKTSSTSKSMSNKMTTAFATMREKAKAATGSMKKNWLAYTAAIAGTILVLRKVTGFIGKIVDLANVQENAEVSLAVALKNSGNATRENFKSLTDYASALQSATGFGDETILGVMKQIAVFGANTEQIKAGTKATVDFAASQGLELRPVSLLVGRAFAGQTQTLARYGITIDEGLKGVEKYTAVTNRMLEMSKDTAEILGGVYTGQTKKATNALFDIGEELGFFISKNPATLAALKAMSDAFGDTAASMTKSRKELTGFSKEVHIFGLGLLVVHARAVSILNQTLAAITEMIAIFMEPFVQVEAVLEKFGIQLTNLKETQEDLFGGARALTREAVEGWNSVGHAAEDAALRIIDSQEKTQKNTEKNAAKLSPLQKLLVNRIDLTGGGVGGGAGGESISGGGAGGGAIGGGGVSGPATREDLIKLFGKEFAFRQLPPRPPELSAEQLQSRIDQGILPSRISKLSGGQTVSGFKSGLQFLGKPPEITTKQPTATSFDLTGQKLKEAREIAVTFKLEGNTDSKVMQVLFESATLFAKENGTPFLLGTLPQN